MLFAGCAGVAEVTGTATQQDLVQLRADMTALQLTVQRMKTDAERQAAAEARARDQSRDGERQTAAELTRRLDALTTSLTTLTARVDETNTRVEGLSRRLTATPPAATPKGSSGAGLSSPPRGAAPPVATTRPSTGGAQAQDLYQAAYIDFSKGSYPLATAGFREFLRRYPDHELAGNAQYWIGEAHWSVARSYANGGQADKATPELEHAVQEFRKVVANYPRGDKAPTALYKEALAPIELKQPTLAQQRLQYLIDNFPQAEETPLARERMASLRGS